jgi:uncharacterized protein (TIGR02145 family)
MQHKKLIFSALLLSGLYFAGVQAQIVKDIDGNVYKTVTIGTQIWMAENLKTTRFNNGSEIKLANIEANDWANHTVAGATTPAYCWLYDSASVYKNRYGAFYNGFTVKNGKLCPAGWHVPSDQDWTILAAYLGGEGIAGGKLKESGTTNWNAPNNGATNESGFTARGGGSISDNGSNWYRLSYSFWWSSTVNNEKTLWTRDVNFNMPILTRSYADMQVGNSVRCVKDETVKAASPKPLNNPALKQVALVSLKNEVFKFEIAARGDWSFSKIVQQDPFEEFRTGRYGSSISTGAGENVPENWNGFRLSSTGPLYDACPFLIIYGHKVGDQKPEDFAKLFERSLTNFGAKDIILNRDYSVGDAIGFDCIYNLGVKVRYTVLYRNGTRVVVQYFFPSNDPTQFEKYAPEIDKVIRSIVIK